MLIQQKFHVLFVKAVAKKTNLLSPVSKGSVDCGLAGTGVAPASSSVNVVTAVRPEVDTVLLLTALPAPPFPAALDCAKLYLQQRCVWNALTSTPTKKD